MIVLLFCPLGVLLVVGISLASMKAKAEGRPKPAGLRYLLLSLASLVLAAGVWLIGSLSTVYLDVADQCPARDAGEFIEHRASDLPLSGALVCSRKTIELVPFWVNPLLFALLAAVLGCLIAAYAVRRRGRRAAA